MHFMPTEIEPWATFWPSLLSAGIASLLTGIFVGVAVLLIQRRMERLSARRDYRRELSLLLETLREAQATPDVFHLDNAVASAPPQAEAMVKAMREKPISLWRDELTKEQPLLDALYDLQVASSNFKANATALDFHLRRYIRKFNAERNTHPAKDNSMLSYCLGRLHEFPSDKILPWLGKPSVPTAFDEAFHDLRYDVPIMSAFRLYAGSRQQLQSSYQRVVHQLSNTREVDNAPHPEVLTS